MSTELKPGVKTLFVGIGVGVIALSFGFTGDFLNSQVILGIGLVLIVIALLLIVRGAVTAGLRN